MAIRTFDVGGKSCTLQLIKTANGFDIVVNGHKMSVTSVSLDRSTVLFEIDGRLHCINVSCKDDSSYTVFLEQGGVACVVQERFQDTLPAIQDFTHIQPAQLVRHQASHELKSPLAGRITRVVVQPGQSVQPGSPLLFIESMKMENEICAQSAAFIKTIFISEGNVVQPNQILIEFEKEGESNATSKNAHEQKAV